MAYFKGKSTLTQPVFGAYWVAIIWISGWIRIAKSSHLSFIFNFSIKYLSCHGYFYVFPFTDNQYIADEKKRQDFIKAYAFPSGEKNSPRDSPWARWKKLLNGSVVALEDCDFLYYHSSTNGNCAPRRRASNLTGAKPVWQGLATHQ